MSSPKNEKRHSRPPQSKLDHIDGFYDALRSYTINPATWPDLLVAFDRLAEHVEPAELVAKVSDAEALSWQMKEEEPPGHPLYGYILLDVKGRVLGGSVNLKELHEYAITDGQGVLHLFHPASHTSLTAALHQLKDNNQSHALVSLVHPTRAGSRFGCLISRQALPAALKSMVGDQVSQALFIMLEEEDGRRFTNAVRTTLGLTAMEAEVATRIAQGFNLKELAIDLGISLSTARNHLQSTFDKSGLNRQSELVSAITRLSILLSLTHYEVDSTPTMKRPPAPARQFFMLEDGRRLAYRAYGDPSGKPVVFLHELFGCSLLPPDTVELTGEFGLYIIAPERPGFGFSDPRSNYNFDTVNQDIVALLDHLRIEKCVLLGYLSGGAFALRLSETNPDRVLSLMLVAARPPQSLVYVPGHLKSLFKRVVTQPWLLQSGLNILRNRASEKTIRHIILTLHSPIPANRVLLNEDSLLLQHLVAGFMESIALTTTGTAAELRCFTKSEYNRANNLPAQVTSWYGSLDDVSDLSLLEEYLAGRAVQWRIFPDSGALIFHTHWRELLATLARD